MENELENVAVNSQPTTFAYDAGRIPAKTTRPNGPIIDTPFPDDEVENPGRDTQTIHITYTIAGRTIALRVQIVNGTNTLYYLHSDHLGSTRLMTYDTGTAVPGSTTRYYPFSDWRTEPTANLTGRGYTGHQHNNLGPTDLGLIYMNARYYLPGTGRFASADTATPGPANPQAWNRYSYTYNNPLAYTDPDGHDPYWCGSGQCMQNYNNSMVNATVAPTTVAYGLEISGQQYGKDLNAYDQHPWSTPYWQHLGNGTLTVPEGMTAKEYVAQLVIADIINSLQNDNLPTTLTNLLEGAELLDLFYQGFVVADDTTAQVYAYGHAHGDLLDELPCSFSADTPVMTIDGLEPISQLERGTLVLAYDEATNTVGYYPILALWEHEDPITLFLTVDGEIVETTPNHPFYTVEGEWVPAGALAIGDKIRDANWGTGSVENTAYHIPPQLMYNFTVATAHTYFVGDGQWLVHNSCNQMDREISRGKAPRGIERVDIGLILGEQDHVHLNGGALNRDGTWKHQPNQPLNNRQIEWLHKWQWGVPTE